MVLAVTVCLCLVVMGLHTSNQHTSEWGNLLQGLHGMHCLEGARRLEQEVGMDLLYSVPCPKEVKWD